MVEMKEVASALSNVSDNSLFIFDEIGIGTATFDGMAIAQRIIEYIVKHLHNKYFIFKSLSWNNLIIRKDKISKKYPLWSSWRKSRD